MKMHAFKNDGEIFRLHVSMSHSCPSSPSNANQLAHCLDTIRQVLMCNVDTGVLGQVWTNPEDPTAFPDFNTKHKCKNYDHVKDWALKLQVRHELAQDYGPVLMVKLQAPPEEGLPDDFLLMPEPEDIMKYTP
jgi:hypothetical protein